MRKCSFQADGGNMGTQREYSSKPHSIVQRILVFKW